MKPIRPELVGSVRGAQRNVRPVDTGSGKALAELGRSISGLGKTALQGLDLMTRLAEERDEANVRNALNQATAEVDARMQSEVYEKTGIGAEGSTSRASGIYDEVGGKYTQGLSARGLQRFQEAWAGRRNNQVRSVMEFEWKQVTKARLAADKGIIDTEVKNYVATGNADSLERAREAYEDSFRIQNGGHLIGNKSLEAFDRDVNDGDGKVRMGDGRILKIVETAEPGAKDVITRAQIKEIRTRMDRVAVQYENGLQNMYDTAHAAVIDRFLQNNDLLGAENYFIEMTQEGVAHPISESTKNTIEAALSRKREVVNDSAAVNEAIARIRIEAGAENQRYGSPEQDRVFAKFRSEISKRYAGDPQRQRRILSSLQTQYQILKDEQSANIVADVTRVFQDAQDRKIALPQMGAEIAAMADSPVKTALQKAYARRVDTFNKQLENDPMFMTEQERKLNGFKLALGKGFADLDGVRYDFSDEESLKAYVLALGFTPKNQKRAAEYISNSKANINAERAAGVLAKLLDIDDIGKALDMYPGLLKDLDTLKGQSVIEDKDMTAWLKSNITYLLSEEVSNYNSRWLDTSDSREDYLAGSKSTLDDLHYDEDQLASSWRQFAIRKAIASGDVEKARTLANTEPTPQQLDEFALSRGLRYDNSKGVKRWYLHRRKGNN